MSKPYEEKWIGASGREYMYSVHSVGDHRIEKTFEKVAGNYIFAKKTYPSGEFSPIYIGQSGNLAERFEDHHKNSATMRRALVWRRKRICSITAILPATNKSSSNKSSSKIRAEASIIPAVFRFERYKPSKDANPSAAIAPFERSPQRRFRFGSSDSRIFVVSDRAFQDISIPIRRPFPSKRFAGQSNRSLRVIKGHKGGTLYPRAISDGLEASAPEE